ncbi:MAG: NERD domain-containing protein [Actinomycetia bacterium]|nr:NERD domain-containing protein [Actinomycetes bacterium]
MRLAGSAWHGGPDDLARNAPGIGVSSEAARRLRTEGAGADRSWWVGAEGEITVAAVLSTLTEPSRLDRLRRRAPAWKVLHSVPVGTGRGDIDHILIGPPGVVTINTKHHRAGRLALDGDELIVNGRPTDYIPTARREAQRAAGLLDSALDATGHPELAARLIVRPVLAVVGGRVLITSWAPGVSVVMTRQLTHTLTSMTPALDPREVDAVYDVARHRAVWARNVP